MSAYSNIDYRDLFEKRDLTPIRGEPTYDTLELLLKELKANARNVHSNLGGGNFGHLGLVISPASYALISPVPFNRPVFPGAQPVIPVGATQHMSNTIRDLWKENLRVYHEVENVDKALKQQIIDAVEPMYLDAIRNRTSNNITRPIFEVLEHLFDNFGEITPETFLEREAAVKAKSYDPNTPVDTLFKDIEDLVDLSGRAGVAMTQAQSIQIAYVILWRTTVFKHDLREWNALPPVQKTWINFKTRFRRAVKQYRQLKGPTVNDSMYQQQHANLVHQLKEELRTTIVDEIRKNTVPPPQYDHYPPPPSLNDPYYGLPQDDTMSTQMSQMANSITQYQQLIPSLVNQVKQLQNTIKKLEQDARSIPSTVQSDLSSITCTTATDKVSYKFVKPFDQYCYTHGLCAHAGKDCKAPRDDHKPEATFFNRMGGSERNCHRAKKKK